MTTPIVFAPVRRSPSSASPSTSHAGSVVIDHQVEHEESDLHATGGPRSPFGDDSTGRRLALGALVLALLIGIPILLSQDDSGAQEVQTVEETTTTTDASTLEPTTTQGSTTTALVTTGPSVLQVKPDEAAQADEAAAATSTTQLSASGPTAAPTTAAPRTSAPTTAAPTTAAPTTAAPTTAAPTTAAPTTAAPTTAAPTTEAPETESAAAPGGQAPTDKPSVDLPDSADDPEPIPVVPEPEAADGEPTAEQWRVLRECESGGDYTIVSSNGLYHGAYQFHPQTWDGTARQADRSDLVGVLPSQAAPADQDLLALVLWRDQGWGPWPSCGKKAAAAA